MNQCIGSKTCISFLFIWACGTPVQKGWIIDRVWRSSRHLDKRYVNNQATAREASNPQPPWVMGSKWRATSDPVLCHTAAKLLLLPPAEQNQTTSEWTAATSFSIRFPDPEVLIWPQRFWQVYLLFGDIQLLFSPSFIYSRYTVARINGPLALLANQF